MILYNLTSNIRKETILKDDHQFLLAMNSPAEFTEENKKLMLDTLKFFYSIHNPNSNNLY